MKSTWIRPTNRGHFRCLVWTLHCGVSANAIELRSDESQNSGDSNMGKKLVLETTAPFQGLAELVAYDEGLFEKEGITVEWADREKDVDKTAQLHITSHNGVHPFASHGKLLEQGKADLYNACEWGNYSRVGHTGA